MSADDPMASIPHRPPFLFVDEVLELSRDRILATASPDPGAGFFEGHYPGNPVMPGVLLCECVFQAGAILMVHRVGIDHAAGRVPVLTRISEAKFRQIVRPGQALSVEVVFDDELGDAYYMTGRLDVDGRRALRVSFVCMLTAE